jgi:hypothetical protein
MNKFYCFIISISLMLMSCNTEQQSNANDAEKITDSVATTSSSKEDGYKKLDILEKLFGNENYLIVDGKDSNYVYFTRLGRDNFFTHSYKIVNGDSAQATIDTIQINKENKVQWNWKEKHLLLQDCNDTKALWQNILNTNDKVDFLKMNQQRLNIAINLKQLLLTKTLPISLFLIRIKYDYQHKTHYAFDTSNFTKRH